MSLDLSIGSLFSGKAARDLYPDASAEAVEAIARGLIEEAAAILEREP